jgi:hypothetical protein
VARGRTNDREGLGWQCGARWTDNNGGWTGGRTGQAGRTCRGWEWAAWASTVYARCVLQTLVGLEYRDPIACVPCCCVCQVTYVGFWYVVTHCDDVT